jgi:hypothetical protein
MRYRLSSSDVQQHHRWPDIVGLAEIAERLGVERQTPNRWRHRGLLPMPRAIISGTPLWDWETDIRPWAIETGRLP